LHKGLIYWDGGSIKGELKVGFEVYKVNLTQYQVN
jgi:hypothetical protein